LETIVNVVKHVLIPVKNIDSSVEFYIKNFGFALKFKDGRRYAALNGGSITLALVSSEENLTGDKIAFSVAVEEAQQFVEDARGKGIDIIQEVTQGPHEQRAVLSDLDGHPIVVFSKS
jgi:predicted enzyme related to lactoylglutathione lyase